MSGEEEDYQDDFEHLYEEDFESDAELEVPAQQQQQHAYDHEDDADLSHHVPAPRALNSTAWPSLSTALLESPPSKGRRTTGPPLFGRNLFAVDPALSSSGAWSPSGAASTDTRVVLQPPPPPLSHKQRKQAAATLTRARLRQQEIALHASTQLSLLMLEPLSLHQQYCQGVGVFAGRRAAACQTRQLGQEVCEQDAQTDQVDQQPASCQVPEDLYSKRQQQQGAGAQRTQQQLAVDLLAASDPAFCLFLEWAVPQVLFELDRVEAEAAAGNSLAVAAAGPNFAPLQSAEQHAAEHGSGTGVGTQQQLLSGEVQLPATGVLAGRPLVGLASPATPQAAVAAAAALTAATAAASKHLLLACYGPVAMPAAAAVSEHGLAGLGCLCVWDLLQAGSTPQALTAAAASTAEAAAAGSSIPHGVLQLLVCEGRPTCCCWGVGEAGSLVFAGMEEGGICCWDVSEPNKSHTPAAADPRHTKQHKQQQAQQQAQQQQQQWQGQLRDAQGHMMPLRRPSYSTEVPIVPDASSSSGSDGAAGAARTSTVSSTSSSTSSSSTPGLLSSSMFSNALTAGAIVGLAAAPSSAGSSGGSACRLLALTASCCVALYSVMLGEPGSDVAVGDLGMRCGSRVWLVKVCEGLPLGMDVLQPPHMRQRSTAPIPAAPAPKEAAAAAAASSSTSSAVDSSRGRAGSQVHSAACLLVLPGATQQLLVGVGRGRVLKGAGLGVTTPPHEYVSEHWRKPLLPGSAAARGLDTDAVPDACGAQTGWGSGDPSSSSGSSGGSNGGWQQQCGLRGAVTSLSACTLLPEVWAAGHSCGCVVVFSQQRSRPLWLWQHPHGSPVVAVRWLPHTAALVALFGGSSSGSSWDTDSGAALLAFNLAGPAKQPAALALLKPAHSSSKTQPLQDNGPGSQHDVVQPSCMEVLMCAPGATHMLTACCPPGDANNNTSGSSSEQGLRHQHSTRQQVAGASCVAVGFSDGSSSIFQVSEAWGCPATAQKAQMLEALQKLVCS